MTSGPRAEGAGAAPEADERPVRVVERRIRRPVYRYFGFLVVEDAAGRRVELPMTGGVAQWLRPGEELLLRLSREDGPPPGFDDYALAKGDLAIWPLHRREYVEERRAPVGERVLYRYRVRAREARFERDFEAIVELGQYHYASDEELLARWWCERCDAYVEANARPACPRCGGPTRFHDLVSATRASRFLVLELLDRAPFEPPYVGYVRVDPPLPLMNRRLPDGTVERHIRERVFPKSWFARPFHPEALARAHPGLDWWELQELALEDARSPVSRLARIVVHPDYRADGLGRLGLLAMIDWVRERWIPEMRVAKQAIETVAMMARYNPFMEKAGFVYLWDTGSGRPTLYFPLTSRAKGYISRFLEEDPIARGHGGRLYQPRFGRVEPLAGPIILRGFSKFYENRLTLEALSEPVRRALEAFGVRQRTIQRFVIREADFEVPPGAVIAVTGASGAGKTTLLRVLHGVVAGLDDPLHRPDGGDVQVPENARAAVFLPGEQEPDFGDLPVVEVLYRLTGDEALAIELLGHVGISDAVLYRAPFRELSTGQKERARLAHLLAGRPNLLLVDEFAAHLDPLTAMRVARRLGRLLREAGACAVLITHRHEVLEALAPDELYMVGYGTLIRQGEPLPARALRVLEPWAGHIVEGRKRWEIRRYPTRTRGRIGIASGGRILGTVEVSDVHGPFTAEELRQHMDRHLADPAFLERYAGGSPLWAWELEGARRLPEPVPYTRRRGQQGWVRLDRGPEGTGDAGTEGARRRGFDARGAAGGDR